MEITRVYLGLGSNVGDRTAHLDAAKSAIEALPKTTLVAFSDVYETAPVGPVSQDHFLNADGSLKANLFVDGTHLSPSGYQVLAGELAPVIERLMKLGPAPARR